MQKSIFDIPDKVKCLIFDCDGTLADTMPIHLAAWKQVLEKHGVELNLAALDQYSGMPTIEIVRVLNSRFGLELNPELFSQEKEMASFDNMHHALPIKPVVELAKDNFGKRSMAVVSGGSRRNVHSTLELLNLSRLFEVVLTADDPVAPKPAPDLFLHVAEHFNHDPRECLVLEDGDAGITGAKAAGMLTIDVREYGI